MMRIVRNAAPQDVPEVPDPSLQRPPSYLSKDELRRRYQHCTTLTLLVLEKRRLRLLTSVLILKRPVQSLRISGLNGLPSEQAMTLIQEIETKATQRDKD